MVVHYDFNAMDGLTMCGLRKKSTAITTPAYCAVTCKRCIKAKNKRDKDNYLDSRFPGMKSDEERDFARWALEAESKGYISDTKYEPRSFILSDPVKGYFLKTLKKGSSLKNRHIFHGCTYTPDFSFTINVIFPGADFFHFRELHSQIWIDTKGTFTNRQNDFPVKSKWLYQRYGIIVQKVIPKKLFAKTWKPGRAV